MKTLKSRKSDKPTWCLQTRKKRHIVEREAIDVQ
jgi:hypothetical protein